MKKKKLDFMFYLALLMMIFFNGVTLHEFLHLGEVQTQSDKISALLTIAFNTAMAIASGFAALRSFGEYAVVKYIRQKDE